MKHIERNEWRLGRYTWCGTTKEGKQYYPVSWNNDSTAYGMTENINFCLAFHSPKDVQKMIEAEIKHSVFFKTRYAKVELVKIKVYPCGFFDYISAAKKLHITQINHRLRTEEIKEILKQYGLEDLPLTEKVLEESRDNGEFYANITDHLSCISKRVQKMKLERSVFQGSTYLMRSFNDLQILSNHVKDGERLLRLYDEDDGCFPTWTDSITFPCLAVICNGNATVHSLAEARNLVADANAMLSVIEKIGKRK